VPWLKKFFAHGNGVAVARAYTSSDWFHDYVVPSAQTLLFPRGKTKFIRPDGSIVTAPGHGVVLISMGEVANTALLRSELGLWIRLNAMESAATCQCEAGIAQAPCGHVPVLHVLAFPLLTQIPVDCFVRKLREQSLGFQVEPPFPSARTSGQMSVLLYFSPFRKRTTPAFQPCSSPWRALGSDGGAE
jgi:hypothetical protein